MKWPRFQKRLRKKKKKRNRSSFNISASFAKWNSLKIEGRQRKTLLIWLKILMTSSIQCKSKIEDKQSIWQQEKARALEASLPYRIPHQALGDSLDMHSLQWKWIPSHYQCKYEAESSLLSPAKLADMLTRDLCPSSDALFYMSYTSKIYLNVFVIPLPCKPQFLLLYLTNYPWSVSSHFSQYKSCFLLPLCDTLSLPQCCCIFMFVF